MTFRRHKQEWFVNRVGQLIRWTVPKSGNLKAVEKMPTTLTIASEGHAKGLYVFHLDNRINFEEVSNEQVKA